MKNPLVEISFQARTRESIRAFTELVEREHSRLQRAEVPDLAAWADSLLESMGYYAELKRAEKDPEAADSRIQNLRDLMKQLAEAGEPNSAPLERMETFLEEITLDRLGL